MSKKVSEKAPRTGQPINITPTTMARMAEISDHQKPGTPRIGRVVSRPTIPLRSNNPEKDGDGRS